MRRGICGATILLFTVLPISLQPAGAQTLSGRVTDGRSGTGVSTATVSLILGDSVRATVTTNEMGQFSLEANSAGNYHVRVERIGYATSTLGPVRIDPGAVTRVLLKIAPDAIPLDALTVEAEARVPSLERVGFYDRRRVGMGTFIDRMKIEARAPRRTSDLLRAVPSIRVTASRQGGVDIVMRAAGSTSIANRNCRPSIYLDGIMVAHPVTQGGSTHRIDLDAILPGDIEAIEAYNGPAQVPPRYGGAYAGCGVVLIWTRK